MDSRRADNCIDEAGHCGMRNGLARRDLFKAAAALVGGAGASAPNMNAAAPSSHGSVIIASDSHAVAETAAGKVRGYSENGIYTFKGIPYGATTAGNARFQAPAKTAPWTAVRDSMQYGPICPSGRGSWAERTAFFYQYNLWWMDEDCLRVNVWTPAINDNRKRPVMFWLHGGGFVRGSSNDLKSYDGQNLARRGNVVVVSINHRLNAFGFLNLAEFGGKYASSVNVGMLDIVAALEWVRENIANFGGDPGNVTIFGWSGGGAKVNYLMAMPSAKGLFHKAVAQSPNPVITQSYSMEQSAKFAAVVVAELGLNRSNIDQIQTVSDDKLVAAAFAATRKDKDSYMGPVVDGIIVPAQPFHPAAPETSANVPLLVGTTLRESGPILGASGEQMTESELNQKVAQKHGNRSGQIIEAFRKTYAGAKPVDLLSHVELFQYRSRAIMQATRKAAQNAASAYLYLFGWNTPVFNGRPRAFHGSEIAFVFDNTDRCAHMTGGTQEARQLAAKVSEAWIHFARMGDPNHRGLPKWPVFTADKVPTMVFDNKCEVRYDHDREARLLLEES